MPAEDGRAAILNRAHHFQLTDTHMATVGVTPREAMVAEDIRDLQNRARHRLPLRGRRVFLGRSQR